MATNLAFRLKMAKQKGEACAREQGYSALAVDPFAIARNCDIEVQPKSDAEHGVSGMLLRHGNEFGIAYATHIKSEGFQRFSVAHELGHYFLEGHVDHVLPHDGIHVSEAGFTSGDPFEMEADQFAAGLLMPGYLFKQAMAKRPAGLAAVEELASVCQTSLTATAIRCAETADYAIAAVISTGGLIDFCFLSEAMKSLPKLSWLRKGTPIPAQTLTARMNADKKRVLQSERESGEVDIQDWIGGQQSVVVSEEVVGLGKYGKTLTIISSDKIGQESDGFDDEESDEDLKERWTPKFHK